MTRSDMVEDGSVEESSEDEPDDAELVHSAAGRCSDDEPLSALKPEGAEQPQAGPPQLEESQRHEQSREEFLHQFEGYLALYGVRFVLPEDELGDELEAMLEGTTQLDGDESQGHEESQLGPEPSMPNETFRAQYTRLAESEPKPRCL